MRLTTRLAAGLIGLILADGTASAAPFSTTFGPEFTFDEGGQYTINVTGLPTTIAGNMRIDLTAIGDLGFTFESNIRIENFTVSLDGMPLGTVCNENSGDDPFGFPGNDTCSQGDDEFHSGTGIVPNAQAAPAIADGEIDLLFDASPRVDPFVNITSQQTLSGVTFPVTSDFALGSGGAVSYQTVSSKVPLPATTWLVLAGIAGLVAGAFHRRRMALQA